MRSDHLDRRAGRKPASVPSTLPPPPASWSDSQSPLVSSAGMLVAYDADLAVNDLNLEGIVADAKGNNVAVVNGKVVKVHDHIGPYVVDVIAFDHVEFLQGTQRFTLGLKKGGM